MQTPPGLKATPQQRNKTQLRNGQPTPANTPVTAAAASLLALGSPVIARESGSPRVRAQRVQPHASQERTDFIALQEDISTAFHEEELRDDHGTNRVAFNTRRTAIEEQTLHADSGQQRMRVAGRDTAPTSSNAEDAEEDDTHVGMHRVGEEVDPGQSTNTSSMAPHGQQAEPGISSNRGGKRDRDASDDADTREVKRWAGTLGVEHTKHSGRMQACKTKHTARLNELAGAQKTADMRTKAARTAAQHWTGRLEHATQRLNRMESLSEGLASSSNHNDELDAELIQICSKAKSDSKRELAQARDEENAAIVESAEIELALCSEKDKLRSANIEAAFCAQVGEALATRDRAYVRAQMFVE